MKNIISVGMLLILTRDVVCLEGGREWQVSEYPFLAEIEKNGKICCAGIIVGQAQVMFPDSCLKMPLFSIGYSSAYAIPLVNEDPPQKYKGWYVIAGSTVSYSAYTGEVVILHLEAPGLTLGPMGQGGVGLPTRAPFSREKRFKRPDVIVVGSDGRVGTMVLSDNKDCRLGITSLHSPENRWLLRLKTLMRGKLLCARIQFKGIDTESTNRPGPFTSNIPPGNACKKDVGSPVIQDGFVVGMVIHAFCALEPLPMWDLTLILRLTDSDMLREKVL